MSRTNIPGTVYLLHFDRPYRHARHYTGWTEDLPARSADHRAGRGARLLEVLRDNGIGFELARTWDGTRRRERQLKQEGGASRRCPMCGITPRRIAVDAEAARRARADITGRRHRRTPPDRDRRRTR